MDGNLEELVSVFDALYDKGYRFLDSMDKVIISEKQGYSEIRTPLQYRNFTVDGVRLSDKEKEKMFNFFAFRKSIKREPKTTEGENPLLT